MGVIYETKDSITGGDLGHLRAHNPDMSEKSLHQIIRTHLNPAPGKENNADLNETSYRMGAIPADMKDLFPG